MLIVAFRNFVKAPKNISTITSVKYIYIYHIRNECGMRRYPGFASPITGVFRKSNNRGREISGFIQMKVTYQLSHYQLPTGDSL